MSRHEILKDIEDKHHHGTPLSYIVGFGLSVVLTLVSFVLVGQHFLPNKGFVMIALAVLALVQLFIQVVFFLHVNTSPYARWNLLSFIFTVFVVVILAGGSLWIMYNLDYYMVH